MISLSRLRTSFRKLPPVVRAPARFAVRSAFYLLPSSAQVPVRRLILRMRAANQPNAHPIITVKEVLKKYSVDELNQAADEYFLHVNKNALMQKPFNSPAETAEVVLTLMHVIKGLKLHPGSVVLDFGAGSCWTSRIMASFGYKVIACDVSKTALEIGKELFERHPVLVEHPAPEFLPFDGHRINLPDASVDAICCMSAFHHIPNPNAVLGEMARVLKPWGRAGFSEPGPTHSLTPQSQEEMRNYKVIENDVVIEKIWKHAKTVGFTDLQMCLFYPEPVFTTLRQFNAVQAGRKNAVFNHNMQLLMVDRRLFIMEKGNAQYPSSITAEGLNGLILAAQTEMRCKAGEAVHIDARLRNTGAVIWRPSDDRNAPVRLGVSWVQEDGGLRQMDREMLAMQQPLGCFPGEEITVHFSLPVTQSFGKGILRLQLVAESVGWFGEPVDISVTVN